MGENASVFSLRETPGQMARFPGECELTGWRKPLKGTIVTMPLSLNCSRNAPILTPSKFVPAAVLTLSTTVNGSEPVRFGSRSARAHKVSSTPLQASKSIMVEISPPEYSSQTNSKVILASLGEEIELRKFSSIGPGDRGTPRNSSRRLKHDSTDKPWRLDMSGWEEGCR